MKPLQRYLIPVFVLAALALGAFGVAFAREVSGSQSDTMTSKEIEFTGVVESIIDNTWTIDGRTVLVDMSTELKDFISLGQTVKVHASMDAGGALAAREIELAGNTGVEDANDNEDLDDDAFEDANTNEDVDDDAFEDENANDNLAGVLDNANDNSDDEHLIDNSNDNSSSYDEDNSNENSSWNDDDSNDNSSSWENDNSQGRSYDDSHGDDNHQDDSGDHDGSGHDGGDDHGDD